MYAYELPNKRLQASTRLHPSSRQSKFPLLPCIDNLCSASPSPEFTAVYLTQQYYPPSSYRSMDWKSLKVFRISSIKASRVTLGKTESITTVERRESNFSEIFSVCGPDIATPATIGLGTITEQDPLPSTEQLQALYKLTVMDRTRNKTPFIDLVQSSKNHRNIVIFIRHFFCPVRSAAPKWKTKRNADTSYRTASDMSGLWPRSCRQRCWNEWIRQPLSQSLDAGIQFSSKTT